MKITVIGNRRHYNLEDYSVRALECLGHEVQFLGFNEATGKKYSEMLRMVTTRSSVIRKISEPYWLTSVNVRYMRALIQFQPELVLSIKGESVLSRTIKFATEQLGARTALWSPDDPRFFNSLFRHIAPEYDYVFSYSSNGVRKYRDIGLDNVHRLTFGCDERIHNRKTWDNTPLDRALFVGTFTPKRYRLLKKLIKNGIGVDIVGKYWKDFLPENTISDGSYGTRLAKLFQKYKVSLNIHNDLSYGPNMRTFEVTGSGGALMPDRAEDMDRFFNEAKEVSMYEDVGELTKLIKGKISEDGDSITEMEKRAYEKTHRSYSYTEIMKNFLKVMGQQS